MTTTSTDAAAPAPTPQAVGKALDDAASAIGAAQILLRQGTTINLSGLEEHVEKACGAIAGLVPGDRDRMKPRLVSLIDSLNHLADELGAQHAEISGTLQGIGNRRRALSAYKPPQKR